MLRTAAAVAAFRLGTEENYPRQDSVRAIMSRSQKRCQPLSARAAFRLPAWLRTICRGAL